MSLPSHRLLNNLAKQQKKTLVDLLDEAVKAYERKLFWDECDRAYEKLWADPKAAAAEIAERKRWDNTLLDGLKDDPWFEPPHAAKSGTRTSAKRSGTSKRAIAPR